MSGSNARIAFLDGWQSGLIEEDAGDSKRLDRRSYARGYNVRIDETGGLRGRLGVTVRAAGLPNQNYSVAEYKSATIHALIASDGSSIRVLDSSGWIQIGTFPSAGTRASIAFMKGRAYIANGIDRLRVVEHAGTWSVREAGVEAPSGTPTVTSSGGNGGDVPFRHAVTFVDSRGFESNVSPIVVAGAKDGGTFTMSAIPVGGATITRRKIYSSLRNQRRLFLVKTINDNTTTSTTYDALNLSRDEAIEGPEPYAGGDAQEQPPDNSPPPLGIFSLYEHKGRLYGARKTGQATFYSFSAKGEAEYWPLAFSQDLSVRRDSSNVTNFGAFSLGLMIFRDTSSLILEGDPESVSAPQALTQGAGLSLPDALVELDGLIVFVSQRGLLAHDGTRPAEIWRRIYHSSSDLVAAAKIAATFSDTRVHFFLRDPGDNSKIMQVSYDTDRRRFSRDNLQLLAVPAWAVDATRDFSTDNVAHENAENGAQTISSGGGTRVVVLSGANSAKLVRGTVMKFDGVAAVFVVEAVAGQTVTLDAVAPANGTAVEYIRGTVVAGGVLKLANAA